MVGQGRRTATGIRADRITVQRNDSLGGHGNQSARQCWARRRPQRVHDCRFEWNPCAPDVPGEILISGPGIAAGYWRNDELTKANFEGGWLHTGDIGTRDGDGAIRIVGRIKDVIISGGMNIYAAEIERVIMEIPGILEVAVIGVPDDSFGRHRQCSFEPLDH